MSTIAANAPSAALLSSVNPAAAGAVDANSSAAAQDRFLTLLVTQMKNQDPLNPMDNAQVTSQLAQLSTVNGIDKLNKTLTALQGSYLSSQSLQAASLIGHGVLLPGSSVTLTDGKAALGVDFTAPADAAKLTIRDGSGKTIRTMDLGSQEIGTLPLVWDGQTDSGVAAANGQYTFAVAASVAGSKSAAATLSYGVVGSVSTGASGVKVNVANVGAVDVSLVKQFM